PIRRTSAASSRTGRSGGTVTGPRAALAKARPNPPFARAPSNTSPHALNQIPRPGRVAVRSNTTALSGPTTKRIIRSFRSRSRVTMHRRGGPVSGSSSAICATVSVVMRLLRDFLGEPMRAGRHDHVIGSALVHVLGADDFDQLVRRQVAKVIECLHALLAEC